MFTHSFPGHSQVEYELTDNDSDGIVVERFLEDFEEYPYTKDNIVFKANRLFEYTYHHRTKYGRALRWNLDPEGEGGNCNWSFSDTSRTDSAIIHTILMKVIPDGGMMATPIDTTGMPREWAQQIMKSILEYNQSVIEYTLVTSSGDSVRQSQTGVIENSGNIWMHPPRQCFFRILELNPFPYVRFPVEAGNTWTWELGIGDGWGDDRWKVWEGSIQNRMTYEVSGTEVRTTPFGKFKCFRIEASAESRIGSTGLVAWYNSDYGFIELQYRNIDDSQTTLQLIRVSD